MSISIIGAGAIGTAGRSVALFSRDGRAGAPTFFRTGHDVHHTLINMV